MKNSCPGCFKAVKSQAFCLACRKRMFDGINVPFVLPFSRPEYNQIKLEGKADRLSISGVQTKISLALENGQLKMVESGGQYILKPVPHGPFQRLDQAPANEHFTMQLARQLFKIEVADNALVSFPGGELAYLVRRFDVLPNGERALQEDFCQISERSEEIQGKHYKYDGSYEEIGDLIQKNVAAHAVSLERFFKLVVYNYLICNGDAHMKNFSLMMKDFQTKEYSLTPAYDLLNTRLHVPDESRTALELFKDDYETDSFKANVFYAYDDFAELAKRLRIVDKRFKAILQKLIDSKQEVVSFIERSMLSDESKRLYQSHVEDRMMAISYSFDKQR